MYPNPSYLEYLSRETIRTRMAEAEKQRMVREAFLVNPNGVSVNWLALFKRWGLFWSKKEPQKTYPPISAVPGKSLSL